MGKQPPKPIDVVLKSSRGFVHKVVFEARYREGYLYLDRCGRVVNEIVREREGWMVLAGQELKGSSLSDADSGSVFSFNAKKYDISVEGNYDVGPLTQCQVDRFLKEAEQLHRIVYDVLDLNEFARIGFRVWYMFPAESKLAACDLLRKFGFLENADRFSKTPGATLEDATGSIVIAYLDRTRRISFEIAERQDRFELGTITANIDPNNFPKHSRERLQATLKKRRIERDVYPPFGALIDVDTFVEDPVEFSPEQFIKESMTESLNNLKTAIET